MTLIRRNETFPGFSSLINEFLYPDWSDWSLKNYSLPNTTLPSVNIKESDENYQIEVAAPGLAKEDFKIEFENDILRIFSEKKDESENNTGKYSRKEFSYQSFCRSFTLPQTADGEKISASYDKGILLVTIPKKEEAKPKAKRLIDIM
ncbi:MAG: Hsp20/alpha crystallin family protein [Bacteroidales bacterium]|nr:Hsp20/alpha crystallin family protein [Bacteroidales bacterium]MDD3988519.1 Hsp20/alpha crystallin family protein [Bacteroidales bacterium]MDD4638206.1 Hsp20/alpha crystallin family protein [Bacteroidales bacterium]